MPTQRNPSPFPARSQSDPEHMMKLLIALNRALDINPNGGSNKNADAHESRRR